MKHLSAKQNLGYPIQVVQFENLFHFFEDEWRNTYDYFEQKFKRKNWSDFIKETSRSRRRYIKLKKSIELEGLQIPLLVKVNSSDSIGRLEFFGALLKIRYALIHDYTSIDAIVEDTSELYNLQVNLCGTACALNALNRSPGHDDFIIGSVPLHKVKINNFSYDHNPDGLFQNSASPPTKNNAK